MAGVKTVLGPMPTDELGITSMHEHVVIDGTYRQREASSGQPGWHQPVTLETLAALRANPSLHRDNLVLDARHMASELRHLRTSGTRSLVDMTVVGLRADPAALPQLSRASDLAIVASTGFYKEPSWPSEVHSWDSSDFVQFMHTELTEAINGTGYVAGHVKCGLGSMSERELMSLQTCATVAAEHGVSLTVHPSFTDPSGPARIVRIVTEIGLPPNRLVIAHGDGFMAELSIDRLVTDPSTWGLQLDKLHEVLDLGATVAVDCFGHVWSDEGTGQLVESDWQRLAGLFQLLSQGYERQLVLGCDVARKMTTRRYGGWGYTRINDWVLPTLRKHGVSEEKIRQVTVVNPARILDTV